MRAACFPLLLAGMLGVLPACATTQGCGRPVKPMQGVEGCWETSAELKFKRVRREHGCMQIYDRQVICIVDGREECVPIQDEIAISCDRLSKEH